MVSYAMGQSLDNKRVMVGRKLSLFFFLRWMFLRLMVHISLEDLGWLKLQLPTVNQLNYSPLHCLFVHPICPAHPASWMTFPIKLFHAGPCLILYFTGWECRQHQDKMINALRLFLETIDWRSYELESVVIAKSVTRFPQPCVQALFQHDFAALHFRRQSPIDSLWEQAVIHVVLIRLE